jgi:hypothetical protein
MRDALALLLANVDPRAERVEQAPKLRFVFPFTLGVGCGFGTAVFDVFGLGSDRDTPHKFTSILRLIVATVGILAVLYQLRQVERGLRSSRAAKVPAPTAPSR